MIPCENETRWTRFNKDKIPLPKCCQKYGHRTVKRWLKVSEHFESFNPLPSIQLVYRVVGQLSKWA